MRKRTLVKMAVAACLAVGAAVAPASVVAHPSSYTEIIYYSDASMTDEVGGYTRTCSGFVQQWGQTTEFRLVVADTPCKWTSFEY